MIKHLLVMTAAYDWLLPPFAYLFRKYYGDDNITVVCDTKPDTLPSGFDYFIVPDYGDGVWQWSRFSNGLKIALQVLKAPVVSIFLPDHFLTAQADRAAVEALADYIIQRKNVIRVSVTANTCLDQWGQPVEEWRGLDIIKTVPGCIHCGYQGGISFCPSLWNADILAHFLEPKWDLWQTERLGTQKMIQTNLVTVGTRQSLLYRMHVLRHATPNKIILDELSKEDRKAVAQWI